MISNTRDPMIPCPDCEMLCGTKDAMLRDRRLYYRCTRCLKFFDVAAFMRSKEFAAPTRKSARLEARSLATIFGDETPSFVIPMRDEVPITAPSAVAPPNVLASPTRTSNPPPPVVIAPRRPSATPPPLPPRAIPDVPTTTETDDDDYESVSASALVDANSEVTPFDVTPLVAIDPNDLLPSSRADLLASSCRIEPSVVPAPSQNPGVFGPQPAPVGLLSWSSRPELSSQEQLAFLPTPTRLGRLDELRLASLLGDETPSLPQLVRATDFRKDAPLSHSRGRPTALIQVDAQPANDDADESCAEWLRSLETEETPLIVESDRELGEGDLSSSSRRQGRPSLDVLALPPLGVHTTVPSSTRRRNEGAGATPPPAPLKSTSFTVYTSPPPKGSRGSQDTVIIRRRPMKGLGLRIAGGGAILLGALGVVGFVATTFSTARPEAVAVHAARRQAEPPPSVAAPPAPAPASVAVIPRIAVKGAPIVAPVVASIDSPADAHTNANVASSGAAHVAEEKLADVKRAATAAAAPIARPAPVVVPAAPKGTPTKIASKLGVTEVERLTAAADRAYRSGSGAKADELYRRALALSPSFLPARLGVAGVAWDQGRRDEAIARYRAMVDDATPGLPQIARDRAATE